MDQPQLIYLQIKTPSEFEYHEFCQNFKNSIPYTGIGTAFDVYKNSKPLYYTRRIYLPDIVVNEFKKNLLEACPQATIEEVVTKGIPKLTSYNIIAELIFLTQPTFTQFEINRMSSTLVSQEFESYNLKVLTDDELFQFTYSGLKYLLANNLLKENKARNLYISSDIEDSNIIQLLGYRYKSFLCNSLLHNLKASENEIQELYTKVLEAQHDHFYRIYHQSFKAYRIQQYTEDMVTLFKKLSPSLQYQELLDKTKKYNGELNDTFLNIISKGTNVTFEMSHNKDWSEHTNQLLLSFTHCKCFLEAIIKSLDELKNHNIAPCYLPSAWASILYLYKLR